MNWQERWEKKMEGMDEKLDQLLLRHHGVYKDVEWLKGSVKTAIALTLPPVIGAVVWLIQYVIGK